MEQTIGKRIAAHRKRLQMTQDALAEQLGVTAQAVSKWENDQSCPDIATLPKLAEIFGITTDELLGKEPQPPVHEAEVVREQEDDDDRSQDNHWELHWNGGRRGGLTFGVFVLLVGVLTLLNSFLQWNVGFWSIVWPSFLLVFGFFGLLRRFSFFNLGCTIFGTYFLLSNLHVLPFDLSGNLVLPVILVLLGVSLLTDALRKPKKPVFKMSRKGSPTNEKTKSNFNTHGEYAEASLSFGDTKRVISLPRLSEGNFSCSFGELTVDISGCGEIADGCYIMANCSFGEIILLVPQCYQVDLGPNSAFGNVEVNGVPDPSPKGHIRLDANVSFGNIEVHYI